MALHEQRLEVSGSSGQNSHLIDGLYELSSETSVYQNKNAANVCMELCEGELCTEWQIKRTDKTKKCLASVVCDHLMSPEQCKAKWKVFDANEWREEPNIQVIKASNSVMSPEVTDGFSSGPSANLNNSIKRKESALGEQNNFGVVGALLLVVLFVICSLHANSPSPAPATTPIDQMTRPDHLVGESAIGIFAKIEKSATPKFKTVPVAKIEKSPLPDIERTAYNIEMTPLPGFERTITQSPHGGVVEARRESEATSLSKAHTTHHGEVEETSHRKLADDPTLGTDKVLHVTPVTGRTISTKAVLAVPIPESNTLALPHLSHLATTDTDTPQTPIRRSFRSRVERVITKVVEVALHFVNSLRSLFSTSLKSARSEKRR